MNARVETPSPSEDAPPPAMLAASLVSQINDAHRHIVAADKTALGHAIRCGELLNTAQETVDATGKGKWLKWLTDNCPAIHQTTANDYMRLAKHQDLIKGTALSIREALKRLPKGPSRSKSSSSRSSAQADNAIKDEEAAETFAQAATEQIENLGPDEVFKKLCARWERDQLKVLGNLIANHLAKGAAK